MKFSEFILKKSESRGYSWLVFFMTICESIFLFIPPEVFMTPPIIANKKRALPITIAAALGSIVGGTMAYMIGMWLYDSLGIWLIETFSNPELIESTINCAKLGHCSVISGASWLNRITAPSCNSKTQSPLAQVQITMPSSLTSNNSSLSRD